MNCQILFSGENKKISSISDLLNLARVIKVLPELCCAANVEYPRK